MLYAVVVAALIAFSAALLVMIGETLLRHRNARRLDREKRILDLARRTGGVVSPSEVARHLHSSVLEANRLLRRMVDDVRVTVEIDAQRGELRFLFTDLANETRGEPARDRDASPASRSAASGATPPRS